MLYTINKADKNTNLEDKIASKTFQPQLIINTSKGYIFSYWDPIKGQKEVLNIFTVNADSKPLFQKFYKNFQNCLENFPKEEDKLLTENLKFERTGKSDYKVSIKNPLNQEQTFFHQMDGLIQIKNLVQNYNKIGTSTDLKGFVLMGDELPNQEKVKFLQVNELGYKISAYSTVLEQLITYQFPDLKELLVAIDVLNQKLHLGTLFLSDNAIKGISKKSELLRAPELTEKLKSETNLNSYNQILASINFTDPNKYPYRNPSYLMNDGNPTSPEECKKDLKEFIEKVENRLGHLGVPTEAEDKKNYYDRIESWLRNGLLTYQKAKQVNEKDALDTMQGHVLEFAQASLHCGSRWQNDVQLFYGLTQGIVSGSSLPNWT